RRILLGLLVTIALLTATWTVSVARRPGNENFTAKSADWLRDHHLSTLADWMEREWYTHNAPPIGGVPSAPIAATPTPPGSSASRFPPTVPSPASPALPNEGVWQTIVTAGDGHPAIAEAQLRPDAIHTSVLGAIVWVDPKEVQLIEVPGTVEPGGSRPM